MAHSRLVVVSVRRCAAEGTLVRAVHLSRVEPELPTTLPRGPRQDLMRSELLRAGRALSHLHRRPLRLWARANLEVLVDAALTERVPAGIERGRPARQALTDQEHQLVGDATFHPLLVNTVIEAQGIQLDAGQAIGDPRPRTARAACAAACRLRIRTCCALPLRLSYLKSGLTARGRLRH